MAVEPSKSAAGSDADPTQRFEALATDLELSNEPARHWTACFQARYCEPQRHYHTIVHIDAMLKCLDEHRVLISDTRLVKLAIFFHDWIYEPTQGDNELQSIVAFEEFAKNASISEPFAARVKQLIERTITHTLPYTSDGARDQDMELFLDFDLEVLSRPPDQYRLYTEQIRKEYYRYSDEEYRRGRSNVLKGFLRRDRIYFSDPFFEALEVAARRNIEAEIERLGEEGPNT